MSEQPDHSAQCSLHVVFLPEMCERSDLSASLSTLAAVRFSVTATLTDVRCYFTEIGLRFHDG